MQRTIDLLSDGIPRFPCEIYRTLRLSKREANLAWLFREGRIARSERKHELKLGNSKTQAYGYVGREYAGQELEWKYGERSYKDRFEARKRKNTKYGCKQRLIKRVFEHVDGMALFSKEVTKIANQITGKKVKYHNIRCALSDMYPRHITRLDETKGWKFSNGYLWAPNYQGIKKRLGMWNDPEWSIYSEKERMFLRLCERGIVTSKQIRDRLAIDEKMIGWYAQKLGKESRFVIKKVGHGDNYHVELEEDSRKSCEGQGLIDWLKYIHPKEVGVYIFYDHRLSPSIIKNTIARIAYWMTDEGRKRHVKGKLWEDMCEEMFRLLDKNNEWKLEVLEHRKRWKGRNHREFDHVYRCRLGPPELGIETYMVFECKSGVIKSYEVDQFYQKLVNEFEFRDWATGGLKSNVIPVMIGGKTAHGSAFGKARKQGIRIVLHTSVEDILSRLKGERISLYKVIQQSTARART
jgi:hypothetical protein